ncbi:hypothetical protein PoB_006972400 [Plakobranchus ocellatus]|uniref:C-type lectin domain-containing protein n=1 Tax=Plakobranchus ocellatus TaxID=259542 RepID=A0AAV4DG57_9GAST|nr:hypothetical protein PoB_006972400 [Plakobranchus ocellatus]
MQTVITKYPLVTVYVHILGILISVSSGDSLNMQSKFSVLSFDANFTVAEQACQALGFDGLAILSTPEEYNYVLRLSADVRQHRGIWLALRFDEVLASPVWDDGTVPAPDMPWKREAIQPCGKLNTAGLLGMLPCDKLKYPACGNRKY